jgi:hypothetical protein
MDIDRRSKNKAFFKPQRRSRNGLIVMGGIFLDTSWRIEPLHPRNTPAVVAKARSLFESEARAIKGRLEILGIPSIDTV